MFQSRYRPADRGDSANRRKNSGRQRPPVTVTRLTPHHYSNRVASIYAVRFVRSRCRRSFALTKCLTLLPAMHINPGQKFQRDEKEELEDRRAHGQKKKKGGCKFRDAPTRMRAPNTLSPRVHTRELTRAAWNFRPAEWRRIYPAKLRNRRRRRKEKKKKKKRNLTVTYSARLE